MLPALGVIGTALAPVIAWLIRAAIVKTIMDLHQGQLLLSHSEMHGGLSVSLVFTLDFAS